MSIWSHVHGTVVVRPFGETQAEKRYVLDSVLAHLPKVTGSEEDMKVYIIQKEGYNTSSTHDEFGNYSNLGNGHYVFHDGRRNFEVQDEYIIVVDGALRDRGYHDTLIAVDRWLSRLAKRILVEKVLIEVRGDWDGSKLIKEDYTGHYNNMFEAYSWATASMPGDKNWCERLFGG